MRRFYLPVPYPCSCQTHGHRPPAPLPCPLPTRCPIQDTSVTLTQVLFISCTKEEYLARVASGKIDNGTGDLYFISDTQEMYRGLVRFGVGTDEHTVVLVSDTPQSPQVGRLYYNTNIKRLMCWDGLKWLCPVIDELNQQLNALVYTSEELEQDGGLLPETIGDDRLLTAKAVRQYATKLQQETTEHLHAEIVQLQEELAQLRQELNALPTTSATE